MLVLFVYKRSNCLCQFNFHEELSPYNKITQSSRYQGAILIQVSRYYRHLHTNKSCLNIDHDCILSRFFSDFSL